MKECPRCHVERMEDEEILNSLSRRAPVYICNECGDEEALIDEGLMIVPEAEQRDMEFAEWCDLQGFGVNLEGGN